MTPVTRRGPDYAIVYLRPDGWWSAGVGWEVASDALEDGREHEWHGRAWGVVEAAKLVDVEGDMRLPGNVEPSIMGAEGSFHG